MKRNLLIVFLFIVITSCFSKKEESSLNNVFYVQTQKVKKRDIRNELIVASTIKAMDEAIIYSRTPGKLIKNLVKEGDKVEKDQAVALVKRDEVGVVYEPAPVPSTISGYVGRVYQDEGSDITPQTPIALVVNQQMVRLQMDISENYAGKIYYGQKVYMRIDAYPDKIFYGKIDKISPVVDKVSRTFFVEAVFENGNNLLKSGMTAQAHIILSEAKNVVSVPLSSIVYRDGKAYVYMVDREKGIAVEKNVIVGIKDVDWAEVRNLKENSEIITVGLYGIKDKTPIKIVNE